MLKAVRRWQKNEDAVVAVEMGMLMPLMLTLLMGMFDTGNAVLTSQKVINATQTVSDLLGRHDTITDIEITNYVEAGRLMLWPNDTTTYGIDIAGVQFDGDPDSPVEMWRDTFNMEPNLDIVPGAAGLGADTEGVIGVTVVFTYEPFFSEPFVGDFELKEVSYVRGRSGLFVTRS